MAQGFSVGMPFGMQGSQQRQVQSKPTFLNQGLLKQLSQMFGGMMGGTAGGYADFVNNPTASPAYQNSLSGLLAALQPGEEASRTALTDQFRAAGGLRGTSYGTAAGQLEGDIIRNQQVTASNLLAQLYPQIAQAMFAPTGQLASLISAMKGQTTYGSDQSQSGFGSIGVSPKLGTDLTGRSYGGFR